MTHVDYAAKHGRLALWVTLIFVLPPFVLCTLCGLLLAVPGAVLAGIAAIPHHLKLRKEKAPRSGCEDRT
jgi:type III secretory pathway component EscS